MRPGAAVSCGVLSLAGSLGLIAWADGASSAAAIIGGTGIVLGAALLCLTLLALRWRVGAVPYQATSVDSALLYEELAAAVEPDDAVSAAG